MVWKKFARDVKNNAASTSSARLHDNLLLYYKSKSALVKPVVIPISDQEVERKYRHFVEKGRRYRLDKSDCNYQTKGEQRRIYLMWR